LAVHDWAGYGALAGRREELLKEAERGRLVRELRKAREAREEGVGSHESSVRGSKGIEVRWGLLEDETKIAELLELNGMPRWVAFEERYVVAEREGEILAALRYRTEPKRLLLGLFISDPCAEEHPLAVALYAGAGKLAREIGVGEVLARPLPHADYPREAGYRRRGLHEWRLEVAGRTDTGEIPAAGRWRRFFGSLGIPSVSFFGAFAGRK
jgi:hypothetical protein